ncbi:molybdenum cofactor guanylyltransferase [Sphingobium cupriresistens]|jgi:molybdopterin-guanine dinucleotide biosynthesis protein A|nr:NTP transferase domain-containing protein [Sphingobium cupriresistens]
MIAPPAPAIVIAAGGEGQRIGGGKPLRLLGGQPLLAHAIANAAAQSDCMAVAVREQGRIDAGGLPLLCDAVPGRGPISALASAFSFAAAQGRPEVLLIGCDQPFLPRDLAARLGAALGANKVAMPVSRGKYQPLAALWRVDEAALADYIAAGGASLWRFAAVQGVVHVAWPETGALDPFANINDPDALAEAETHLSRLARKPAR